MGEKDTLQVEKNPTNRLASHCWPHACSYGRDSRLGTRTGRSSQLGTWALSWEHGLGGERLGGPHKPMNDCFITCGRGRFVCGGE
jgi:hypothetical protein